MRKYGYIKANLSRHMNAAAVLAGSPRRNGTPWIQPLEFSGVISRPYYYVVFYDNGREWTNNDRDFNPDGAFICSSHRCCGFAFCSLTIFNV
jgi:hypothetical protein